MFTWWLIHLYTVNSEIFANFIFAKFRENKTSRKGKITLSFIDIGKSCLSREFFTSLMCLMLFAKIIFLRKFPNWQYVSISANCPVWELLRVWLQYYVYSLSSMMPTWKRKLLKYHGTSLKSWWYCGVVLYSVKRTTYVHQIQQNLGAANVSPATKYLGEVENGNHIRSWETT